MTRHSQIIGDSLADAAERLTVDTYIAERASRGLRSLGVAESSDGGNTWVLVGLISLLDPPRPDSAATIKRAQALGVEVTPVTHLTPIVVMMFGTSQLPSAASRSIMHCLVQLHMLAGRHIHSRHASESGLLSSGTTKVPCCHCASATTAVDPPHR